MFSKLPSAARRVALSFLLLPLAGCNQLELMNPKGSIGTQEKDLILIALGLMLLVVIPVMVLTVAFAWRYRESNTRATYAPKWAHSTGIEAVVWSIPCVIVATLAVLVWKTTHSLDPYRPLESDVAPVNVEVVALNWKWLFIYPDYGVATVNRLPIPVGTPINFRLTSESIMNSFFIPQLGSQIYAMAGMETQLHLIADQAGTRDAPRSVRRLASAGQKRTVGPRSGDLQVAQGAEHQVAGNDIRERHTWALRQHRRSIRGRWDAGDGSQQPDPHAPRTGLAEE